MNDKPEALQLADWFEGGYGGCELEAAAELRRLVAVNQELLKALKEMLPGAEAMGWNMEAARAAIAKAEGQA